MTQTYIRINMLRQRKICVVYKQIPCIDEAPGCQGRFRRRGNNDGYIGKVVRGSISHNDTLGCLSPAVDSSQPTYNIKKKIMKD